LWRNDSNVTWQEIGHTCDSACSCPCLGSKLSSTFVDSLSKIAVTAQLITWLSWVSHCWFVLLRLDACWLLVKGLLVIDYTSVLCSFNLHRESKKCATLTMAITLSILGWFAKFFHYCKEH